MKKEDIDTIAEIHYKSLPNDYLPSLGLSFLRKVYYSGAFNSPYGHVYVYQHKKKIVGFINIAWNNSKFLKYIFFRKIHWIVFIFFTRVLWNVKLLKNSIEILFNLFQTKMQNLPEIVFIAVQKEYRGKGIGKKLVLHSIEYLKKLKLNCCVTKTLSSNLNVIHMYKKIGGVIKSKFRLIGQEYVYIILNFEKVRY